MATVLTHGAKSAAPVLSVLATPFVAIGRFLVTLAEAQPRMVALQKLSDTSDEELAARGVTRDGEMRRIMGVTGVV
ncbi:hypothetical protein [Paracoccus seriniphilus]|uniref:DUF1127 domain-containing protein n=1 Tax=Paracoccus seriniphilus TaxID=184748 RepID=A0A239PPE3_9RHOB|nr:hypothetical protein [Paracoccus seriniphilus]WCR14989.1 hypothetical protein JHW44_06085 [Paracoccus seriniphilus]SNT71577.1 hypothetical protein SAMN05444959_10285 [Paracoccus seriniphilus]